MKNKFKYKKLVLIFFINLTIVICLILLTEYIVYRNACKKYEQNGTIQKIVKICPFRSFNLLPDTSLDKLINFDNGFFRKTSGLEYIKKPILLFGCSFVYGALLEDNQIFSYKLSQYTRRPVYNFGGCTWGVQHMLYLLKRQDFYKHIKSTPEYIIYTIIPDHLRRSRLMVFDITYNVPYLRYEIKDGALRKARIFPDFFYCSYLLKELFLKISYNDLSAQKENYNVSLIKAIFIESKKHIDEHYPGTKFVILKYNDGLSDYSWFLKEQNWNELENQGFIIVNTDSFLNRPLNQIEDLAEDGYHPSEKAWDLIVPKLAEKLNL